MNCLVALHTVQPATPNLVTFTMGHAKNGAAKMLVRLVTDGFVERYKSDPYANAPITELDRNGLTGFKPRRGRRPFMYRLTPLGNQVAEHLVPALELIDKQTGPYPTPDTWHLSDDHGVQQCKQQSSE